MISSLNKSAIKKNKVEYFVPEDTEYSLNVLGEQVDRILGKCGTSQIETLQMRAARYQQHMLNQTLEEDILSDHRSIVALQEEIPVTSSSLGVLRTSTEVKKFRSKFVDLITLSNNFEDDIIKCDCCLSTLVL